MSRRRYLSTEISTDSAVNRLAVKCGDFAALLYTWMIPHAEDDCTVDADPWELLMRVAPGRRDKSEADVEKAIDGMLVLGLVERCEDLRRLRFPPDSFYKYQTYITGDRRKPASAAQNTAEQRNSPQNIASSSVIDSFKDSDIGGNGAAAPSLSQEVHEVWDYYKLHIQPKARICPQSKIRARLKKTFTVQDLKIAIDHFKGAYWWMKNCSGQGGEWFFENDSRIDKFLLLPPETQEEYEARETRSNPPSRRPEPPIPVYEEYRP